jgi:hypothetical protein
VLNLTENNQNSKYIFDEYRRLIMNIIDTVRQISNLVKNRWKFQWAITIISVSVDSINFFPSFFDRGLTDW